MVCRSVLLVLLVLGCLQSFTEAQHGNAPQQCCFKYQKSVIPERLITKYEQTDPQCTNHGVIFTLNDGRTVCANPNDQWVKNLTSV